jgi:hypothetical protein
MKELILAALPNLEVSKERYLTAANIETLAPVSELIAKQYPLWVDADDPLYSFFTISSVLRSSGLLEKPGLLKDTADPERLEAAADAFIGFWEDVPYTYEFVFPLPSLEPREPAQQIAQGVSFKTCARSDAGLIDVPQQSPLSGLFGFPNSSLMQRPQVRCLFIEAKGVLLSAIGSAPTLATAIRKAKIVIELGIALGALRSAWTEGIRDVTAATVRALTGPPVEFDRVPLEESFAEALPQTHRALAPSDGAAVASLSETLAPVGVVLDHYERWDPEKEPSKKGPEAWKWYFDEHCARIVTAAEWLFDARNDGHSPTTFVQTAIAFEAIYGGAKSEQIVETLTNRIAYTLGRAPQERLLLAEEFREFYSTRSKVVHRGASRLTGPENRQLIYAQNVLRRALRHELELVARGAKAFEESDRT